MPLSSVSRPARVQPAEPAPMMMMSWLTRAGMARFGMRKSSQLCWSIQPLPPSSSQPNFSRALRATSALGALVAGKVSRQ